FQADRAGVARFVMSSASGIALPQPVGYISDWRIPELTLDITIAPASIAPLAYVTLEGPAEDIPLGNEFDVRVFVHETASNAAGILGGVLDVYFDPALTSYPSFDAATAIQAPYTDIGITSGTLLESRIDELGGATTATGHGNGTPKLFAILTFKADALGEAIFEAKAGSSGLTLTSPVGQLDFSRIDYGPPAAFTIAPNYHLVLTSATYQVGNGNYTVGTVVPIQADAPATGMIFEKWDGTAAALATVDELENPTTTVTIGNADVALTALYRNILYTLAVNNGSGDTDQAIYEQEIVIQADAPGPGKAFDHWEGDTAALKDQADITHPTATVKMPADHVTLTAVYRNILYALTVVNGTGGKADAIYGEQIAVAANSAPTGYEFSHWTGNTELLTSDNGVTPASNDPTAIVTMAEGNATVTAVYKNILYALTVNSGSGSTNIAEYLQQIPIVANAPETGREFDRWTGNTEVLQTPGHETSAAAMVTIPTHNVTLTANYRDAHYTLTVNNGAGDTATATYEQEIQIAADRPPIGQRFKEWQGDTQHILAAQLTNPNPTVKMPAGDVTLTAVFQNVYRLTVVDGTGTGDYPAGEVINVAATPRPDGAAFVEWTHDVENLANKNARVTTFETPGRDTVILPTFIGDSGGGGFCLVVLGGSGSGRYVAGESVTIIADMVAGSNFVQWAGMITALGGDYTESTATFNMPGEDIAVRAITDDPVSIDLQLGWNLFSVERLATNPATMIEYTDTIGDVWSWGDRVYFNVEEPGGGQIIGVPDWHQQGMLVPGYGYWLYSNEAQTIILP
ncbi:MAG: hypothetical protein KAI66_23275, partial [Lentisphaeria bacterium]|nr:hypothetical protein [Lentisphaeria bacterium]